MNLKELEKTKSKIIESLKQGKTLSTISQEVFHTSSTARINNFISKYGIPIYTYNSRYLFMKQDWLSSQIQKYGDPNKVAAQYNMPRTSVVRYARRFGMYERKFSRLPRNKIDESYFKNIDTPNKAYWLGLFMADSNLYHYKDSDKVQFEIKLQQSDHEILVKLANDIGFSTDKIKLGTNIRNGTQCPYASLRTYNKVFCDNLQSYGIVDQKSGKEIFPPQIPSDFKRDFVRGFWDGDGHIGQNKIDVCSMSFSIISSLSQWLCSCSIFFSVRKDITSKGKDLYLIIISAKSYLDFANIVYYPGCLGLQRKKDAIKNLIGP